MSGWSWKDGDAALNSELNLLYEPGNWGDVLKGVWAAELLAQMELPNPPVRIFDPYSGALDYPCTKSTRRRLWPPFSKLQRSHLKAGRLASTGRLLQDACARRGLPCSSVICEQDPKRRASWESLASFRERPPVELLKNCWRDFDLVCWDPYDFFEQWSHAIPHLLLAGQRIPVLIYLYNKAPRGVAQMRNYERLRERIGQGALYGRAASDGLLPRAYHEMILLAPEQLLGRLEAPLRKVTRQLHRYTMLPDCFERQVSKPG